MKANAAYAIVVSEFNDEITDELLSGAVSQLIALGVVKKNIKVVRVPGAVEIPLVAKLLAKSKKYKAIICLGAVIQGDTNHYDYVCQQVSDGCQRVMLDHEVPVIFGILTTRNLKQAKDRIGGKEGHKGKEAAEAAVEMVRVLKTI